MHGWSFFSIGASRLSYFTLATFFGFFAGSGLSSPSLLFFVVVASSGTGHLLFGLQTCLRFSSWTDLDARRSTVAGWDNRSSTQFSDLSHFLLLATLLGFPASSDAGLLLQTTTFLGFGAGSGL
jgi:hypothetical protein